MHISKKYLFYLLAMLSAVFASINAGVDAFVNKVFISDPWVLGFAIFFVGIPITTSLIVFFSIPIKKQSIGERFIDPSFRSIRLIQAKEIRYQIYAGVGNAIYTLGYLSLFSLVGDPSVVLPFTQMVILYIVVVESLTEKNMPTLIEVQSSVIVMIGAVLGTISLTGMFDVVPLLIVLLFLNPGWMILTIFQRKLKHLKINGLYNDSLNIRLWNVIFTMLIVMGFILGFDYMNGTSVFIQGFVCSIDCFWWVALISLGTFFSYAFFIRALGFGKASVTQAIRSSSVIFSIPVSLVLSSLAVIQGFLLDPSWVLIKVCGIILIVFGILSYALTQIKAYIFISVNPDYHIRDIMRRLWSIGGVTHVSAVSGPYDLIVKIRTRNLLKGYERIIRRIERVPGILGYKWESVLREWENI